MFDKKDGDIAVFPKREGDHAKAPDFKGTFKWAGEELELALWKRTSKNGLDYLSGKVGPKRQGRGPRID